MISGGRLSGDDFSVRFRAVAGIEGLSENLGTQYGELAASIGMAKFPGAILLCAAGDDSLVYYAIAPTAADWRRLHPLLTAFAGPTLTDFVGLPSMLDPELPIEQFLMECNWHAVAKLRPGPNPSAGQMVARSLRRLLDSVQAAPDTTQVAPVPTSRILSRLVNSLNGSDRSEAMRLLKVCRDEMRLDALNLSFLEVQIHEHFSDWRAIYGMPTFASMLQTRRPPSVTGALLETLYREHLAATDDGSSLPAVQKGYWEHVRGLAQGLLIVPVPPNLCRGGWRLYGLECLASETKQGPIECLLREHASVVGSDIIAALGHAGDFRSPGAPIAIVETGDLATSAKQALAVASETDSLASIREALGQLERLSPEQRDAVLGGEPFRTIWRSIQAETHGEEPADSWLSWLRQAKEPRFSNALGVARRGLEEWPLGALEDTLQVELLSNALTTFPDETPAIDRLTDALPLIVNWLSRDENFPRSQLRTVYDALLFYFVVSARRGSAELESATILIRALLTIGLPEPAYNALLSDVMELLGPGLGTRTVDCALEIVEETIACQSPSPESRIRFWYEVLARIEPIAGHLTTMQRIALRGLGASLGWDGSASRLIDSTEQAVTIAESALGAKLKGKRIGIYSLTESAARQAAATLEAMVPSIHVLISNDHVGNAALKSLATSVDILVMATASAKHAATTFIQQWRPRGLPLLYSKGRGCTSILRAIEDYAKSEAAPGSPTRLAA